jgi:hypothetical protein
MSFLKTFPADMTFPSKANIPEYIQVSCELPTALDQDIALPFSSCGAFSDAIIPSGIF